MEAAYNSSTTCHKVRVAKLETEENDKLEKLLQNFYKQIINGLAQGRNNGAPPKKSMECYGCQGHFKRVLDHQVQGEALNIYIDLLNEMCRKTKNS